MSGMDERESPEGALKMVSSGAMYALSLTILLNYTMQFEWLTTFSSPSSSASLSSTPLSVTRDQMSLMKAQTQLDANQKFKKRLTEYFAIVRLKELNGDKEVQKRLLSRLQPRSLSASWNPIDAGKPAPWLTFRPFNKSFAICSLSKHCLSPIKGPKLGHQVFKP